MRAYVEWELIFYFVDNAIVLTPPMPDGPDRDGADKVFSGVVDFLDQAAVPYHQVVPPTTRTKFLGWVFDTVHMTVEVCPERRDWMRDQMADIKVTPKAIESVVGILEFLSGVICFLKAPTGWLRRVLQDLKCGKVELGSWR